jgi:hypothetical protein
MEVQVGEEVDELAEDDDAMKVEAKEPVMIEEENPESVSADIEMIDPKDVEVAENSTLETRTIELESFEKPITYQRSNPRWYYCIDSSDSFMRSSKSYSCPDDDLLVDTDGVGMSIDLQAIDAMLGEKNENGDTKGIGTVTTEVNTSDGTSLSKNGEDDRGLTIASIARKSELDIWGSFSQDTPVIKITEAKSSELEKSKSSIHPQHWSSKPSSQPPRRAKQNVSNYKYAASSSGSVDSAPINLQPSTETTRKTRNRKGSNEENKKSEEGKGGMPDGVSNLEDMDYVDPLQIRSGFTEIIR